MQKRILVIIGDEISRFVQATGALQDIRSHHSDTHITLLVHRSLKKMAASCPWVDDISYDAHIPLWPNPIAHFQHRQRIKYFLNQFDIVYDFQHNHESKLYMSLSSPNKWCSCHEGAGIFMHPKALKENPLVDIFRIQLSLARVSSHHKPDITYLADGKKDILQFYKCQPGQYVVLIPGSRRSHIQRRWPHYLELGKLLAAQQVPMVIVGSLAEESFVTFLAQKLNIPLIFNPDWPELVTILQNARYVVGNDTGPFYFAIASGAQGTILYGPDSANKRRHAPKSTAITVLEHEKNLAAVSPHMVLKTIPKH